MPPIALGRGRRLRHVGLPHVLGRERCTGPVRVDEGCPTGRCDVAGACIADALTCDDDLSPASAIT